MNIRLVMKPETELPIDLARQVPVESAEGKTVVVEDALIRDVEGGDRSCEAFAEVFAKRKIEGSVTRKIVSLVGLARHTGFSIAEARAIVNVGRSIGTPGKCDIGAYVERVALIMVERSKAGCGREVGKATGDGTAALRDLIGVGEVNLGAVREAGR